MLLYFSLKGKVSKVDVLKSDYYMSHKVYVPFSTFCRCHVYYNQFFMNHMYKQSQAHRGYHKLVSFIKEWNKQEEIIEICI